MKCYIAINNAFYESDFKDVYDVAGSFSSDAVELDESVFNEFSGMPPAGKTRAGGEDGLPEWVDVPAPSHDIYVAMAETTRSILLSVAKDTISIWQSELLLGTISDKGKASLTLWIAYIKQVHAVDTSTAPKVS